jgi:hypothetical protein
MRQALFAAVAALGGAAGVSEVEAGDYSVRVTYAQHGYGYGGGYYASPRSYSYYGGQAYIPQRAYYGGNWSGYGGGHWGHGGQHSWHDTSHYDYHPGGFERHRNHYHYVPAHYDFHQEGHWDHHHH